MGRRPAPLSRERQELSRRMRAVAAAGAGVITTPECHRLGADKNDLRALLRHPGWARAERGVYVNLLDDPAPVRPFPTDHHRECAAALASIGSDHRAAVSHLSAVRLLGLPTPHRFDQRPTLTRQPPAPANSLRHARVHVATFEDSDLLDVVGVPVVAGPRLILDCCQVMTGESALAVADAMLGREQLTLDDLARYLAQHERMRGAPLARLVHDRADGNAANWFESASRWWLLEAGLPRPRLQAPFADRFGRIQAEVDMLFPGHRTIGEADGRGKYDGPGALFAEKQREDWLRSEHRLEVVRWTYSSLRTPGTRAELVSRLLDAFERAERLR